MNRCERGWWSWRGRSRASDIGGCVCWAARGSMLTTSECIGVSGRIDDPEEEGETLRPRVGQPLRVWAAANHK
jgi:hypothetical protein